MQESIINQLSAYLDGELSDSERESIEQKLAASEKLRQELNRLRRVRDWLTNYPGRRPSHHVWSDIRSRLQSEPATSMKNRTDRGSLRRRIGARVAAFPPIAWFGSEGKAKRLGVAALIAVAIAGMGRQVYLEQLASGLEESSRIRDEQLSLVISESKWQLAANGFRGRNGELFSIHCPRFGSAAAVWGTDVYTDDSSICTAAVHSGLITYQDGGVVTFRILPGKEAYAGSARNGVETHNYSSWRGSFAFQINEEAANTLGERALMVTWESSARDFRDNVGRRITFECPAGGTPRTIWGTDFYTDDSSICTGAVHSGLITFASGGVVTIEIQEGQSRYRRSHRNGVESKSFRKWPGSFRFVNAPALAGTGAAWEWIDWTETASNLRGWDGLRIHVACPAGGSASRVWGTGIYTDDSSICTAAVHSGIITFRDGW